MNPLPLIYFPVPFSGLIPGCGPETTLLCPVNVYQFGLTYTWLPLSYLLTWFLVSREIFFCIIHSLVAPLSAEGLT